MQSFAVKVLQASCIFLMCTQMQISHDIQSTPRTCAGKDSRRPGLRQAAERAGLRGGIVAEASLQLRYPCKTLKAGTFSLHAKRLRLYCMQYHCHLVSSTSC